MQKSLERPPAWAVVMPMAGNTPIIQNWEREPVPSEGSMAMWVGNYSLALRTGKISKILCLEVDASRGGVLPLGLEVTCMATCGSVTYHYYRFSGHRVVDVFHGAFGPGIKVVYENDWTWIPPGIHPDTGMQLCWLGPSDAESLAEFPRWAASRVWPRTSPSSWSIAAVAAETTQISAAIAGDGTGEQKSLRVRDALLISAYRLGQISSAAAVDRESFCGQYVSIAGEHIDPFYLEGIGEDLTASWNAGTKEPRSSAMYAREAAGDLFYIDNRKIVLVPGQHTDSEQFTVERGIHDVCREIMECIPEGRLYRQDVVVGEIVGETGAKVFRSISPERMRLIVDEYVALNQWVKTKRGPERLYVSCSPDLARVIIEFASRYERVRDLRFIARHPVFAPGWTLVQPGWNAESGILYDEPPELLGVEPGEPDLSCIYDLIVDFPFKDVSSVANLIGLMLTTIIRPAIRTAPIHLVQSSIERTGKGKLIQALLGYAILGRPVPSMQLGEREEEREKRITAMLLKGDSVIHIDNLAQSSVLDSASLASLVTAECWMGRTLGTSTMPSLPNYATVIASANNLRASSEVTKRIVPIWLEPADDKPELRSSFTHEDIDAYARSKRREVVTTLVSMVAKWAQDMVPGKTRLGGFEQWAAAISGIMEQNGLGENWMLNRQKWTEAADEWGQNVHALGLEWWARFRGDRQTPKRLFAIVEDLDLFSWIWRSDNGKIHMFARRVLAALPNRPLRFWKVRCDWNPSTKSREYWLEPTVPVEEIPDTPPVRRSFDHGSEL